MADTTIEGMITLTLDSQPENATHWSTRAMARRVGMSQSMVSRVWRAFGLQPHRTEIFNLSTDPAFVDKLRDVVGLYMAPPHRAVELCVDERPQIQTTIIHNWLVKRPRWHLHFTPTSASWLHLVEGWFALLTRQGLQRGVFE